jgi:hypothetical protein
MIESVQELSLPYIPFCMFKNEKFGGFVAENHRALTMLSPWIFGCLLDKEFSPSFLYYHHMKNHGIRGL